MQPLPKRFGACCSLLHMAVCMGGWCMYLTATLFPTTILCLLVMVFQLHVTSAKMNAFVFLCQYITCVTTLLSPSTYTYVYSDSHLTAIHFFCITVFLYLDFFKYYIPVFCISSNVSESPWPHCLFIKTYPHTLMLYTRHPQPVNP